MKYFLFANGTDVAGPYWSYDYTIKEARNIAQSMQTNLEIRDDRNHLVATSAWHGDWHDPMTDPEPWLNFGETGWFEKWKLLQTTMKG